MTATTTSSAPTKNVFRLHGVNVLNRKNVDSISRLTALEKRRATHILDERQRRDTMNQLLAELANLVRESSAEAAAQAQQQQEQEQQQTKSALNPDGTDKKPPVKSNSITTLRNAIAEIRRLRTCAGLETTTPPCPASLAVLNNNSSLPSAPSSRSTSPSLPVPSPVMGTQSYIQHHSYKQQQQFPALAPMSSSVSIPSSPQFTTPVSSPKSHAMQQPLPASFYSHQSQQLQSPPLSPSSPASHKYSSPASSSVSPALVPTPHHSQHSIPSLPSLFASSNSPASFSSYQQQPQQYNHPSYAPQHQQQQQPYYQESQPHHHHHQQQQQYASP
ncbi:hypothetical protein BGZ94_004432, partial [Podila epigama]